MRFRRSRINLETWHWRTHHSDIYAPPEKSSQESERIERVKKDLKRNPHISFGDDLSRRQRQRLVQWYRDNPAAREELRSQGIPVPGTSRLGEFLTLWVGRAFAGLFFLVLGVVAWAIVANLYLLATGGQDFPEDTRAIVMGVLLLWWATAAAPALEPGVTSVNRELSYSIMYAFAGLFIALVAFLVMAVAGNLWLAVF